MTDQIKQSIIDDYCNSKMTVIKIAEKHNVSRSSVTMLISKAGIPSRHTSKKFKKICGKCNKVIGITDAKFCPYCGEILKTETEKLIDRLEDLMSYEALLPKNIGTKFHDTIIDTIRYIEKRAKEDQSNDKN